MHENFAILDYILNSMDAKEWRDFDYHYKNKLSLSLLSKDYHTNIEVSDGMLVLSDTNSEEFFPLSNPYCFDELLNTMRTHRRKRQ